MQQPEGTAAPPTRNRPGVGTVHRDPAGLVLIPAPTDALKTFVTPASQHYVLAHHGIAHCVEESWTLHIGGLVDHELILDLAALRRRPARSVTTFLECAGNPEEPDLPTRIVSNATWRGVPLAGLLSEAGLAPGSAYVWMCGEDWGNYAGYENEAYVKDIPLDKAIDKDVLVAYEMNGRPLDAAHGSPLRAIVPGYYGTNSVKWLSQVSVQRERPKGLFTTRLYNTEVDGVLQPAWEVSVNSILLAPRDEEILGPGATELTGWAWAKAPVSTVHLSIDGGDSWFAAQLDKRRGGSSWQRFSAPWTPSGLGQHTISVRATDAEGAAQPEGLHINQIHHVTVTVADEPALP